MSANDNAEEVEVDEDEAATMAQLDALLRANADALDAHEEDDGATADPQPPNGDGEGSNDGGAEAPASAGGAIVEAGGEEEGCYRGDGVDVDNVKSAEDGSGGNGNGPDTCLLYTSPSPRDRG